MAIVSMIQFPCHQNIGTYIPHNKPVAHSKEKTNY